MSASTSPRSSWFSKFFDCYYLYVIFVTAVYLLISSLAKDSFYTTSGNLLRTIFVYGFGVFLLISIYYSISWHSKEKQDKIDSATIHALLKSAISYFIAFVISGYGFAKILRTQFEHLYFKDDVAAGQMNGLELTWYYFSHSYPFAVILGCIQIVGGILLTFRRTRLLATCILLPVMLNILLINLFYDIAIGAFIVATVLTVGLIHLLLSRWEELKVLFLAPAGIVPHLHKFSWLKFPVILIVIATSYFFIYNHVKARPETASFAGKWRISEMKRNGKPEPENAWIEHASSFHKIYIEEGGGIEFSANPYVYDEIKGWQGSYQFDARKNILNVFFNGPTGDTTKVIISNYNNKSMQWNTVINKDTLQMKLYKE